MSIFVDTSGFLALMDSSEEHHKKAAAAWTNAIGANQTLCTTNYVIVETVSLLQKRAGIAAVRSYCDDLLPACSTEWVEEALHSRAIAAVITGGRAGPSLVDCSCFEVMRKLGILEAIAFDRHFSSRGYKAPALDE